MITCRTPSRNELVEDISGAPPAGRRPSDIGADRPTWVAWWSGLATLVASVTHSFTTPYGCCAAAPRSRPAVARYFRPGVNWAAGPCTESRVRVSSPGPQPWRVLAARRMGHGGAHHSGGGGPHRRRPALAGGSGGSRSRGPLRQGGVPTGEEILRDTRAMVVSGFVGARPHRARLGLMWRSRERGSESPG